MEKTMNFFTENKIEHRFHPVLVLPYEDIQSVELEDAMLNTVITIRTWSDTIRLTTQKAELNDLRSSGMF